MNTWVQTLMEGLFFLGMLGLLGFPFFVWRRPPAYYWRCPRCFGRNPLETRVCVHCEHAVESEPRNLHLRADWTGSDLAAIFLVAWFASVVVGLFLLAAMGRMPTTTSPTEIRRFSTPEIFWPLEFVKAALFTVLTIWMLNGRFRWSLGEVGFRGDRLSYHLGLGALVGVALFLLRELYERGLRQIPLLAEERAQELALLPTNLNDPLWIVILPTLLALTPLGGEIFYRGMLYRLFRSRYTMIPALVANAFVYALTMGSFLSFLPFFAMGIANAYLFERTGTLIPGIASRAVASAVSLMWTVGSEVRG